MNYLLQRYSDDGESTQGLWFRAGQRQPYFQAHTLEDESRVVKLPGETRIWAGNYLLALKKELTPLTRTYRDRFSWFSWHVEVMGVKGFTGVYVHVGNTEKDTDACILLGDTASNNQASSGLIGASVQAYRRWYEEIVPYLNSGGASYLEVRDESWLVGKN